MRLPDTAAARMGAVPLPSGRAATYAKRREATSKRSEGWPRVPYDLLIKGGHVLDPGQAIDRRMDIAISDGAIAAIQPEISASEASRVLEVRGSNRYVVPGLIDVHTHVAYGATTPGVGIGCVDPDVGGVGSAVTTVLDAGSVGIANVGVFGAHLLPKAKTRVICYVNVGTFAHTTPAAADVMHMEDIDRKAIAGAHGLQDLARLSNCGWSGRWSRSAARKSSGCQRRLPTSTVCRSWCISAMAVTRTVLAPAN